MSPAAITPDQFSTFGELLKHLRRQARLTQRELAIAVGYSDAQISRIEQNQRVPDAATITALFVPALYIEDQPKWVARLLELANTTQDELSQPRNLPPFLEWQTESLETEGTTFVARATELARLSEHLKMTLAGQGRVVLVTGEAGSGKTALLGEFGWQAHLASEELLVTSGYCNAQSGQGDPFLPFRQILRQLMCDIELEPVGRVLHRTHLLRLWDSVMIAIRALVEHSSNLANSFVSSRTLSSYIKAFAPEKVEWLEKVEQLTSDQASDHGDLGKSDIQEQFVNVLQTIARQKPLLLLIDDLHWADAASISLLFHLGRRLHHSRILLVGAFRPNDIALGRGGERHPLEAVVNELKRHYGEIELNLDEAEGREFVDAWLDTQPNELGSAFRATLYRHTKGQPLFTVELLRAMQERKEIVRNEEGHWVEGPELVWGRLPARTEAVIEERLARAPAPLREVLITASVEGEVFTPQVVAQVQGIEERHILHLLSWELEKRYRLVRKQKEVRLNNRILTHFQFAHVLFQQYLYSQLSMTEKQLLHGQIAEALTELYKGYTEQVIFQLAHHFAEAGNGERAVEYLLKAGDQARGLYAHQEAVVAYRRALSFLVEMKEYEQAARVLMKLGLTYHLAFDFLQAREAYDEGFALWERTKGTKPSGSSVTPHALRTHWQDPQSLDPAIAADIASAQVIDQLFSGLVEWSPELDVVPAVSRTWEVLDGGRRYVFYLKEDVRWSDGAPLTAKDFEYAWKRVLHPATKSINASLLYDIKSAKAFHQGEIVDPNQVGVRAHDDVTLVVELEEPTGYFPHLLTHQITYPVPRHVVGLHGDTWTDPRHIVTNGPFRLETWEIGESMTLSRNPHYHGQFTGNVERVDLMLVPPNDLSFKSVESYEANDFDVLGNFPGGPPPIEMDRARQRHAQEYISGPLLDTVYIGFDVSRPPFNNTRVRKAFVLATNRQILVDVILNGNQFPATGGFVPPGMPGHSVGIGIPYDPDLARRLLATAGYLRGRGFPEIEALRSPDSPEHEYLKAQWRDNLGVEVAWKALESSLFADRLENKSPHVFLTGWLADYPDPDNFLRICPHARLTHWHNETYIKLVEDARRLTNQEERLRLYGQADRILIEDAAVMPLYYWRMHLLVKPWVKRFPTSAIKWWFWKDVVIESH